MGDTSCASAFRGGRGCECDGAVSLPVTDDTVVGIQQIGVNEQ